MKIINLIKLKMFLPLLQIIEKLLYFNTMDSQTTLKSPIIIGLCGEKGNGKDTIAEYLIKNHNFVRYAFADTLKDFTEILFGFSHEQLHHPMLKERFDRHIGYTPRYVMQQLGTKLFRDNFSELFPDIGENVWVNIIQRKIQKHLEDPELRNKNIIITDVRFENEATMIKQFDNSSICYCKAINRVVKNKNKDNHSSEQIDFDYDYIIENDFNNIFDTYKNSDDYINKLNEIYSCSHINELFRELKIPDMLTNTSNVS